MRSLLPIALLASAAAGIVGHWDVWSDIQEGLCGIYAGGFVWFGTRGGVVQINPETEEYRVYTNIDGLGGLCVVSVVADDSGFVWYAAQNGYVGALVDGRFKSSDVLAKSYRQINKMTFWRGNLWICTSTGLVRATPVPKTFSVVLFNDFVERMGDLPAQTEARDVCFLHDTIFVATPYGVAYAPTSSNLLSPESWDTVGIYATAVDSSGTTSSVRGVCALAAWRDTLWALAEFSPNLPSIFALADGNMQPRAPTTSLYMPWDIEAADDTLWVMHYYGLCYYDPTCDCCIGIPSDAPNYPVYAVVDAGGKKLCATGYGYGKIRDGSIHNTLYNAPLGENFVDVAFGPGGEVVAATSGFGVSIWDGERWRQYDRFILSGSISDSLSARFGNIAAVATATAVTGDGTVWLASYGNGVLRLLPDGGVEVWDATNSDLFTSVPSLDNFVAVTDLEVDPFGNLWMACYETQDELPVKVWLAESLNCPYGSIGFSEGLPGASVNDIACGAEVVGVATNAGGAVIVHKGTIEDPSDDEYYNLRNLLPNNEVNAVAVDTAGRVWFGTTDGLAYFDPKTGYVVDVPMPGDLSAMVLSLASDSSGNVWIGTSDGAALYMPDGYFSTFKSTFSDDAPPQDRTALLDDAVGAKSYATLGGVFTDGKSGDIWFAFDGALVVLHSPYSAQAALPELEIYPNPAVAARGILPTIYIGNLPADAPALIYDAAGNLVREIPHWWKGHSGFVSWDGRNDDGKPVASGVYVVAAPSKEGVAKGKILIVR